MSCRTSEPQAGICIKKLHKNFRSVGQAEIQSINVFKDFSLDVHDGEFLTVFGPNGCGKTTLLQILAGLIHDYEGEVLINGKAPGAERIGFIFQLFQSTLLPWKRNIDNIAWPLALDGDTKTARRAKARTFLEEMAISLPLWSYPYQLSGGQQQLLAIARALISKPRLLLLDEPFSNLDYQTRTGMQMRLLELWARTKTTVVFVSHDIEEALLLGDRTVMLTRRPARVLEILTNSLPRPRDQDFLRSPEFFLLRSRALEIFARAIAS